MQDFCNLVQKYKGVLGFFTWQLPTHRQKKPKNRCSLTQCGSSILWFQLSNASCYWNLHNKWWNKFRVHNTKFRYEFLGETRVSALWAHETEKFCWGKGCLKTPFRKCIVKSTLKLQVARAFGLTLDSYAFLRWRTAKICIIPITEKWFCLRSNGSNTGILTYSRVYVPYSYLVHAHLFLCFPY